MGAFVLPPLRRLVIGRLIGRSARASDLGFYSAPSVLGSFQNPTLQRRKRRPEASYHRMTVPFSDHSSIDHGVFFSLFGGSVTEYARFFAGISFEGLNFKDSEELGAVLSGAKIPSTIIKQRLRNSGTVSDPTAGGMSGLLPSFGAPGMETGRIPLVEVDRAEWVGLQTEINGGAPVRASRQLPYFFDCAAAWGAPLSPAKEYPSTSRSGFCPFTSAALTTPPVELHC